ncbi:hypothetical protein CBR_g4778, partial [Chara braunii]
MKQERRQGKTKLIFFKLRINGCYIRALTDYGATANYFYDVRKARLGMKQVTLQNPCRTQVGNQEVVTSTHVFKGGCKVFSKIDLKFDDLLDAASGCKVFSKIDLKSGYHQVEVDPADQHKIAFKTRDGLYEFTIRPFGLTNSPATFQSLMDKVFRSQINRFGVVYLDDILICSKSMKENMRHLEEVLQILKDAQLHLNLEKSEFGRDNVIYLGHRLSAAGLELEATKFEVIRKWPQPTNVRELRSFLGLASYYRTFVPKFSIIARPLSKLTSKNVSYTWDGECTTAFQALKEALLELLCSQVAKMANLASADGATAIRVVASPYRICPIGAHIDHQGGPVTAMAISAGVLLGFVPSKTSEVRLRSNQFRGEVHFSVDAVPAKRNPENENEIQNREAHSDHSVLFEDDIQEHHEEHEEEEKCWGNFIRGAAVALKHRGYELDQGIIGIVDGTRGMEEGGVSSSAAVGVACLLALENANGIHISAEENIELDRLIENGYLGLRNGILDQSAILLSRQNCLTVIDCKERTHMLVKSAGGGCNPDEQEDGIAAVTGPGDRFQILLAFSGLKKALTSTPGYNRRVDECCEAARILMKAARQSTDEKPLLGNITMEEYTAHKEELGEVHAKRAAHFFGEVRRVYRGLEEWKCGNLAGFGKLVSESGASSINNYEC